MQPLDKNTLFSIFEQGDEEVYKEHNVEGLLDNPFVLIGMAVRGVENYHIMDLMYQRQYGNKYKDVQKEVKYKYYTKLFSHLNRVKFSETEAFNIGNTFEVENTWNALNEILKYFEDIEQYEKCAVIKKAIDLVCGKYEESFKR